MAEKLSERMKRLYRPALDVNFIPEVEALEAEVKTLKTELEDCRESTRAGSSTEADYIDKLEVRLAKAHDWLSNTKPRLTELGTFVTSDEFYELKKALGDE
jgi:hypothetical protein